MLDTKQQAQLNSIIQKIYETAIDSDALGEVLHSLESLFAASMVSYLEQSPQTGKGYSLGTIGLSQKNISQYTSYYGPRSQWFKELTAYKQGAVFVDQMMVNYDGYLESETYNDFQLKHDMAHGLALITQSQKDSFRYVVLRRSKKLGFYDNDELQIANTLLPHLLQANQIQRKLAIESSLLKSFEHAFNHLAAGVALVNTKQEVVFLNQAAKAIIKRQDGLNMSRDTLSARDPNDNTQLKQAIQKAFALHSEGTIGAENTCTINRRHHLYPYQLLIMPLAESCLPDSYSDALALVMIHDPNSHQLCAEEVIANLYGLTKTEARIAQSMCNLLTTSEIAEIHDMSENGVRFHSKNIYQKLQVKRQADVVSLILNGPVGMLFNKP